MPPVGSPGNLKVPDNSTLTLTLTHDCDFTLTKETEYFIFIFSGNGELFYDCSVAEICYLACIAY